MKKNAPTQPFGTSTVSNAMQNAYTLQHLAFESSLLPQLITNNSNGDIILANLAACNLFGYTSQEILATKTATLFGLNESQFQESLLRDPTATGTYLMPVTAIRKSGDVVHCEVSGTLFIAADGTEKANFSLVDMSPAIQRQQQIDTGKEKTVADNIALANAMQKLLDIKKDKKIVDDIILALAKSDARLAENNEWKKYIGKTSYDVMWDWQVGSKDVYVSDSILEVFGYKVANNKISLSTIGNWLLADERRSVETSLLQTIPSGETTWKASFMLKCRDGSFAMTTARASIVRDEQGKAVRLIGAVNDVSRMQELEKKLKDQIIVQEELSEIFLVASKLSFDARWAWNLITNEFFVDEGFEELFGYPAEKGIGDIARNWSKHIPPVDRHHVEASLQNAIRSDSGAWEDSYRFIKSDGTIARVINRASIIRNHEGKACRIIGVMQDTTRQKGLEEQLEHEITTKHRQIAEATEQAKEMERSDIGKELHDNVNQLLGVSKLYLDLARGGGKDTSEFLNRSSEYTLTAIDEIRKLTKGLTTDVIQQLGLCLAIENIAAETMQIQPIKVICLLSNFIEETVEDKFKLNIFRMVQEQLNNIIKHAKATTVIIELSQSNHLIILAIKDDGEGFDTSLQRDGIGIENIKNRAASYEGIAEIISTPGGGCELIVTFPVTN